VATPNTVPFAPARHPPVLGVWLGEEFASKGDNGLGRVPARDPRRGAVRRPARCAVDERAAPVGRGGGGARAALGELLRPARRVPRERVRLLLFVRGGIVRIVVVSVGMGVRGNGDERATL
jgi:hypothetical protein